MVYVEIGLLAVLGIVNIALWLRLDSLQHQLDILRDQLQLHRERGHGPALPAADPPRASLPATPRVARAGRPPLRLVRD